MFPKVPQAENAYLALYYHPGAIHKKWWRRNFAKLNNFSGIAMADRGSDRIHLFLEETRYKKPRPQLAKN